MILATWHLNKLPPPRIVFKLSQPKSEDNLPMQIIIPTSDGDNLQLSRYLDRKERMILSKKKNPWEGFPSFNMLISQYLNLPVDYRHVAPMSAAGDLTWNIRNDECHQRELCTFDKYKFAGPAYCRIAFRNEHYRWQPEDWGTNGLIRTNQRTILQCMTKCMTLCISFL